MNIWTAGALTSDLGEFSLLVYHWPSHFQFTQGNRLHFFALQMQYNRDPSVLSS
jgi:hypothetical protein